MTRYFSTRLVMFTRYSYAGERSTNPLESAISLGGGGQMFPGTVNPGVHSEGPFGQSEMFGTSSIHGEVEPAIMGEGQHQANYVPIVHNFAFHADPAYTNVSGETFFPKGALVRVIPNPDNPVPRQTSFNAPGIKPHYDKFIIHGMQIKKPAGFADDSILPKDFTTVGATSPLQFLTVLPLAEGSFYNDKSKVNYMSVAVGDTATIFVPEARPHVNTDPLLKTVEGAVAGNKGDKYAKIITVQDQRGDFPAGSLVYVTPKSQCFKSKIWVDIVLSTVPLKKYHKDTPNELQLLGMLRVPYSSGTSYSEAELMVALTPVPIPSDSFQITP
jgi:hypothetical protein